MVAISDEDSQKFPTSSEVLEEVKRTVEISFPVAAMSLANYVRNMAMIICMGKLGTLELAGGALAVGFTNITGYSILSGLAGGMEPLCSQAVGSKSRAAARAALVRTTLILLSASFPIAALWLTFEPFMKALKQDADVARLAGDYCFFALPDLLANCFLLPVRIFLRSRGTAWPLMWTNLIGVGIHVPLAAFLTFKLSMGVGGVAVSAFVANFSVLLFLLVYLRLSRSGDDDVDESSAVGMTWRSGFLCDTVRERREWGVLVKLSMQSCLGVCLEWWWYELVMILLAGYLPSPRASLATSAIVIQTTSLMYTLPHSLAGAASTRVGNDLGAGRPARARLAARVAIALSLAASLLGLTWTTLGREPWVKIFTDDVEVRDLAVSVLPVIGICELANCPQTAGCGVLRGSARPGIGAAVNFYAFYLVGAPIAVGLGFAWKLGFAGLCYGLLAAQIACVAAMLTVVHRTDWESESVKARELVATATDHVFARANHHCEKLVINSV